MFQLCLIYFYFSNINICTKRYHGMHKYQQVNFSSNVIKSVRPTYGNKEELVPLTSDFVTCHKIQFMAFINVSNIFAETNFPLTTFSRMRNRCQHYSDGVDVATKDSC